MVLFAIARFAVWAGAIYLGYHGRPIWTATIAGLVWAILGLIAFEFMMRRVERVARERIGIEPGRKMRSYTNPLPLLGRDIVIGVASCSGLYAVGRVTAELLVP